MSTQKRIFPDKGRRSMNSERLKRAPDRGQDRVGRSEAHGPGSAVEAGSSRVR